MEGLKHKPPPGAPPRLSEEQRERLPELLAQGAPAHGFRGDVWTCARVAEVIWREFEVRYHPAHVSRLLAKLQALFAKARAPGEPAGRGGYKALEGGALAASEKRAIKEGRTVLFVDQSGFYLSPMVVRTYALRWARRPSCTSNSPAIISR